MENRNKETIREAFDTGRTLRLKYRGNQREVIPLVLGTCKNGKESLLCYRLIGRSPNDGVKMRLYHLHKVSDMELGQEHGHVAKRTPIDYYLTKHFVSITRKI